MSGASQRLRAIPVRVQGTAAAPARHPWVAWLEAFFVHYRERVAWVHVGMLAFFLILLFLPPLLPDPPEDATPLTHFTTFANYVMWGLWFPLVFLSVVFTGRSWCGLLCPMGAASELANRVGLERPIPAWVRWEGTPVVSFLLVTIWGQTVGVRDHAEALAIVFGSTLAAAVVLGFLYGKRKRAWCRHMCPIGLLLGVFSRLGAVQFAPKHKKPGGDTWTETGLCPTMIDISRKQESRHCIECFRCVYPEAKGGLYVKLRRPGREVEAIRDYHPNPAEVWFFFLGTGAALGGFLWLVLPLYQSLRQALGEWAIDRGWYWIGEAGPRWLMAVYPTQREVFVWLDFFMIITFMLGCMGLLTALLWFATDLAARLAGRAGADLDRQGRFVELAYQYMPVAMVSLLIGLGGKLFEVLNLLGFDATAVQNLKLALFLAGLAWSLHLGNCILERQGVAPSRRWLPLLPGMAGSLAVAAAWWPAVFGAA